MLTTEELIVKRIDGAMRGLRLGTKKIEEVDMNSLFNRLNKINKVTYETIKAEYDQLIKSYSSGLDKETDAIIWY